MGENCQMSNIVIKNNALNNLNEYIDVNIKSLIVTDDLVPTVYVEMVKKQLKESYVVTIEHGEHHKTLESYFQVMKKLLEEEFTRHDQIIALGGGIVCDLTGFVASSYKRGINFINIPTTTLAMIDASVGGKTAINFEGIKNVIGSFYQAKMVIIDSMVLKTLPRRHFFNGLVEALKMGLCLDHELYELFLTDDFTTKIDLIIEKAVKAKLKVVEADPYENHLRKVLNFGHTIGHAIEATHLDEIYHGEAVASGMLYAIRNDELKTQVQKILIKMQINASLFKQNSYNLLAYIANDKKKNQEKIDFIFLYGVEKYQITPITLEEIAKIIDGGH